MYIFRILLFIALAINWPSYAAQGVRRVGGVNRATDKEFSVSHRRASGCLMSPEKPTEIHSRFGINRITAEARARARSDALEKAKAKEKAKADAQEKAKADSLEKARTLAADKAKAEAEEKAKAEAPVNTNITIRFVGEPQAAPAGTTLSTLAPTQPAASSRATHTRRSTLADAGTSIAGHKATARASQAPAKLAASSRHDALSTISKAKDNPFQIKILESRATKELRATGIKTLQAMKKTDPKYTRDLNILAGNIVVHQMNWAREMGRLVLSMEIDGSRHEKQYHAKVLAAEIADLEDRLSRTK